MGSERKQIWQLSLDYLASVASQTVHRIFDTTSQITAYRKWRTVVFLQSGGCFKYNATSTEEIDNVYVLAATGKGGGRWLRSYEIHVSVQEYGAVPDANFTTGGGTDNTLAIQKCIDFCDRHNLVVTFYGIGGYRTTGPLLLKRNIRGIDMSNTSPLMPTGSGYWYAMRTEAEFNWTTCKIKIVGPSVVIGGVLTRVGLHGVQLNNPQRSNIESIEVYKLAGKGIDIINMWDSDILTATTEDCGDINFYAYNMRGNEDISNMSNVLRLQVERSHERAIFIEGNSLCVTHHNIHSEQALVTSAMGEVGRANPYTWIIGGGSCDYHNIRLNATNDATYGFSAQYAKLAVRGGNVNIYSPRVESAIDVDLDANGGGPIDIWGAGALSGKTQSLGTGPVRIHRIHLAYFYGVTDGVVLDDCQIDTLDIGFSPRLDAPLKIINNTTIQFSKSSYVHARAWFDDCEIFGGTLPQGYAKLTNTRFRGNLLVGYTKVELFNSEIIGNVYTDVGYLGMYNTSRITGSLSVGAHPMVIIDQTSTVTGAVTGMQSPDMDLYYPGGWVDGMITRNPKTFDTWQFYQGSWVRINVELSDLFKAGDPALSDVPQNLKRVITNTLTNKTELVYNKNGVLMCIPFAVCTGTPPATAIASITGHYELVEIVNNAPTVNFATEFLFANQGVAFDHPVPISTTFVDADGDTLTYTMQYSTDSDATWIALPAWADYTGGHFTGTPPVTSGSSVTYRFRVTANDGHGGTVSDPFNLICVPED